MEKIEVCAACEIAQPNMHANSDELQIQWFMQHYGQAIAYSLLERAGRKIVKQFQEKPTKFKILSFSMTVEEIRDGN